MEMLTLTPTQLSRPEIGQIGILEAPGGRASERGAPHSEAWEVLMASPCPHQNPVPRCGP